MGCKIGALKLLIVVPNLVFFASGCIMIGLGSYGLSQLSDLENDKEFTKSYKELVKVIQPMLVFLLVVGIIQSVVAFLGFCGALADKIWMLKGYAIVVAFMILLQIVSVIMVYVCADDLKEITGNHGDEWEDIADMIDNYCIGIVVNCSILAILALSACFLSTKIKQERMVFL